jgi:predicted cupin superfamily sugar epimerase
MDRLIRRYDLQPHPEGGFFRETYRSAMTVLAGEARLQRCASTAICYLLPSGSYSAWHRIASDELWHFHAGDPLDIHVLAAGGGLRTHRLGNPLEAPDVDFQAMVPAGCWFAAEVVAGGAFAFVGCTVAPGFEFSEFELADAAELTKSHPEHDAIIRRLSRPPAGQASRGG